MSIIERYRQITHNTTINKATEIFDVRIIGDELWLTHCGGLVCPCSMLKDEPVAAINKMRELYVERNG